jgi:hypothetical protein
MAFGPPAIPNKVFSTANALENVYAGHMAREDAGYESEDERDA